MERLVIKEPLLFGKRVINSVRETPEQASLAVAYGVYSFISLEAGLVIMGASGGFWLGRKIFQGRGFRGLDRNRTDV